MNPFLKGLVIIFLMAGCALTLTYLTLPWWLPSLVKAQLAQGWQLESLEFDYPVSSRLHINTLVLNGNPNAIGVGVTAHDLNLDIFQRSLDATNVNVSVVYTEPQKKAGAFTFDDLTIPTIFRPGKLPQVAIRTLRVDLQTDGNSTNSWLFENVQLERLNPDESRLNARLPLPLLDGLYAQIEIQVLHDSLKAQVQLHLPDHDKILQVDFQQGAGAEDSSSEISGRGDLQALQPLMMVIFPKVGLPLDKLKSIRGDVSFAGYFAGKDRQILDRARITARKVMIGMGKESLDLDLEIEAQREQDWIEIDFRSPGTFKVTVENGRISKRLNNFLPVIQEKNRSRETAHENLELTVETNSKITLPINAGLTGEFTGAASLELVSNLLDLSLELARDSQFQLDGPLAPPSLTGSGTISLKLETRQALTLNTPEPISLPLGANLQASGRLALDGYTVQFSESTRFKVFTPRLIADPESGKLDFHELGFSGVAKFSMPIGGDERAAGFHYSGSGELELGGSTVNVEGNVGSDDTIHGNVKISGEKVDFSLAESTLKGINFDINGKFNESLSGSGWFSIDRIALAAGLNLLQTRASVGLITPDTIELDNLQANFFGGTLSTDQLRISPLGLDDTQIKMMDIDLGQVLEYIDIGSLKGTGILDISVPAGSRGSDLYIRDGTFRAQGPGVLNYSGSMPTDSVENVGLSALENFHYSELDGTINYQPDGAYQLTVHLAGNNPDLFEGYPIALNLNINGKLPKAFEVLFLTGNFDQAVMDRIKQK